MGLVLIIGLMIATTVVLVIGITLMARGGENNRKYSNKLMVWRVALQGLALGAMAVLLMLKKSQ